MTAINVFLQREVGHIVTDAAWYDIDGRVLHFGSKAQPVAHWPGAIALRGPAFATGLIALEAGLTFQDFDAFMDGAVEFLRAWCERESHQNGMAAWGSLGCVQMTAVGWSKQSGCPRAFITASATEVGDRSDLDDADVETLRLEAYRFDEIETGLVLPMPTMESLEKHGVDPGVDFDEVASIADYGTKVLLAQREIRAPLRDGGEPACFVGGYVMHTSVSQHGVSSVRRLNFPDRVGEPMAIDSGQRSAVAPIALASFERPVAKMTRQQRRAAEAQAKRGRSHA